MNYFKLLNLTLLSLLLTACSHSQNDDKGSNDLTKRLWICDTDVIVEWQPQDSSSSKIQLRIDDSEKLYILSKVYITSKGTLYSNGELAFRVKDQSGMVFWAGNDEIIGQNCRSN